MQKVFLRVFVPFLLAWFLSSFFSSVNGILSVYLIPEFYLTKIELGAIFSTSLLVTAVMQFPLGNLIDYYGPRRVQVSLFLIAAAGMGLFAIAYNAVVLFIGATLMGMGFSGGLIAGFKAMRPYVDVRKIPLVDGLVLASGVLGGFAASWPVVMLLHVISWRELMFMFAVLSLLMAGWFYFKVPDPPRAERSHVPSLVQQFVQNKIIFKSVFFWQIACLVCFAYGSKTAFMGLWAVPWLSTTGGFSLEQIAKLLMMAGLANFVGDLSWGFIAERMAYCFKQPVTRVLCVASVLFIVVQVLLMFRLVSIASYWPWVVFGFCNRYSTLAYAALAQHFDKDLMGSSSMAINICFYGIAFLTEFGMGLCHNYAIGFGVIIALQGLGLLWFVCKGRKN